MGNYCCKNYKREKEVLNFTYYLIFCNKFTKNLFKNYKNYVLIDYFKNRIINFSSVRFISYSGGIVNNEFIIKVIVKHNHYEIINFLDPEKKNDKIFKSFILIFDKFTLTFYLFMSHIQDDREEYILGNNPIKFYNLNDKETPCIISINHKKIYLSVSDIKNIFYNNEKFLDFLIKN